MIEFTQGNIFDQQVRAIVNPVNCVGTMGRGLALQFKARYPATYEVYRDACQRGRVQPGRIFVTTSGHDVPLYIFHFPTKLHWRDPSKLEDIESGLAALATILAFGRTPTLAVPPIGCGLGGLSWSVVRPLIVKHLGDAPSTITVLEPASAG